MGVRHVELNGRIVVVSGGAGAAPADSLAAAAGA